MSVEGGSMPSNDKLQQMDAEFDKLFNKEEAEVEETAEEVEEETIEEEAEETVEEEAEVGVKGDETFQATISEDTDDKKAHAFKEMREEKAQLKKELEEKERKLKELEQMSKASGFNDVDQLLSEWKKQQIQEEAKTRGVPANVLEQIEEQKLRLEKLEQEKNELERKTKQQTVVSQIDKVVEDLKLSKEEADTLINNMGSDGVTWEQLLVLPPAAINNAIRGYASPIVLEKQRQELIKKQQAKEGFQEPKIADQRQKPVNKNPFSKESLQKEMEEYRRKNFPHLK